MSSTLHVALCVLLITHLYGGEGAVSYATYHADRRSSAVTPSWTVSIIEVSWQGVRCVLLLLNKQHVPVIPFSLALI